MNEYMGVVIRPGMSRIDILQAQHTHDWKEALAEREIGDMLKYYEREGFAVTVGSRARQIIATRAAQILAAYGITCICDWSGTHCMVLP